MAFTKREIILGAAIGLAGLIGNCKAEDTLEQAVQTQVYTDVENVEGKLTIPEKGRCAILYTPEKNLPPSSQWSSYQGVMKKWPGLRIFRVMPDNEEGKKLNNGKQLLMLYEDGKQIESIRGNMCPGLLDNEMARHFDPNCEHDVKIPYFPDTGYPEMGCCKFAIKPGDMAPDMDAETFDGKKFSLKNERGTVVYIEFWATWCGPCVGHIPAVKKVYDKYNGKGLKVISVSLDADRKELSDFLKKKPLPYDVIFGGDNEETIKTMTKILDKYQIAGIPNTYLIDREGKVAARGIVDEKQIEATLQR